MCLSSGLWGGVLDCDSQFTILSPPSFDGRHFSRMQYASMEGVGRRKRAQGLECKILSFVGIETLQ